MSELRYPEWRPLLERLIGYLTFSSGSLEPAFFSGLDQLTQFAEQQFEAAAEKRPPNSEPQQPGPGAKSPEAFGLRPGRGSGVGTGVDADLTRNLEMLDAGPAGPQPIRSPGLLLTAELLLDATENLRHTSPAFADCRQARSVIEIVFQHLLPAYRAFHCDLLFHSDEAQMFQPFFLGRCFEAVLSAGEPWTPTERVVESALNHLNDYVGYRPVATLEQVRHTTYRHERFRPVPVYIQGAGVSHGPYQRVIEQALEILSRTDSAILRDAHFDPQRLQELAVDIRAYDFDHPVNKRPNYHFGLWDPDQIGPDGYYHRFVIHQIMLDSLANRLSSCSKRNPQEFEFEIAGTLAGTILMGAGVSGSAPDSHDSTVTLSTLLPIIANYRDDFYDWLLDTVRGPHRERLEDEMRRRRQPFGGVRQHLNADLADRRAMQVQHLQLAKIFAKMGYHQAASRQAAIVPVASARIICRIDCLLSAATDACLNHQLPDCLALLRRVEHWLLRGIECGALVDPWNLLGFDGNFPLFPSPENSVPDHRVDDLIAIVEQTLDVYSHLLAEAAAADEQTMLSEIKTHFARLADWWRKYAAHELSSLQAIDAAKVLQAAEHVADALRLWKQAGSSAGDVAFWAQHAEIFDSPKAYQLVVDALLARKDLVASQALLIHWLSQASWIGLVEGETSYNELVLDWLGLQQERHSQATTFEQREQVWNQVGKFYDFMEANADQYRRIPKFQLSADWQLPTAESANHPHRQEDENDPAEDSLFGAAYEDVVYADSTNDGVEGPIFETDTAKQDELEAEAKRLIDRLSFLHTLAVLWYEAASIPLPVLPPEDLTEQQLRQLRLRMDVLDGWILQADSYEVGLSQLLRQVMQLRLPQGNGEIAALLEYDRMSMIKETVMDRIATTSVDMQLAVIGLQAVRHGLACQIGDAKFDQLPESVRHSPWVLLFAGIMTRNVDWIQGHLQHLLDSQVDQPLLYVPLGRGGDPDEYLATRLRQQCFQRALASLPLLGQFQATYRLLKTARAMERRNLVGFGATTEYDEMFRNGFSSMVQALIVAAADSGKKTSKKAKSQAEERLFQQLDQLTKATLSAWVSHSRTLRLSVLEKTLEQDAWDQLVRFIKRYGGQLFTQDFLNLGNIRAILHQGVENWLRQLQDSSQELDLELLNDLDHEISMAEASRLLTLVLEAVRENFSEYRDYNSTTTQSDRGDLLYTFLDFLRLRCKYDQFAWLLKPVVWAHQILVKNQINGVAGRWRRQLAERFAGEANRYLKELAKLQSRYSMRMPTVADRLGERFVQPLQIDRLCALVEPAMHHTNRDLAEGCFELLEKEAESLTQQPMGVGLEIPTWLIQLEQEVDMQRVTVPGSGNQVPKSLIDPKPLDRDRIQQELDHLTDWQ